MSLSDITNTITIEAIEPEIFKTIDSTHPYTGEVIEVEEDNDTSDLTITEIGLNTDLVVGTGDTASGKSAMKLDSDGTTTGAAQLRILAVSNKEDNALGTSCKWDVLINEHELRAAAGGVSSCLRLLPGVAARWRDD